MKKKSVNPKEWNEFCAFQKKFQQMLNDNYFNMDNKYIVEYLAGFTRS